MIGYDEFLDEHDEEEEDSLAHYGTKRHSGRYPWGSGENPYQHDGYLPGRIRRLEKQQGRGVKGDPQQARKFLEEETQLRKKGLTQLQIANALGYKTTSELRAAKSLAINEHKADRYATATALMEKCNGNRSEVARRMGINESTLRSILKPKEDRQNKRLLTTMDILKKELERHGEFIDVGKGSHLYLGVSQGQLTTAVDALKNEGYSVINIDQENLGSKGKAIPLKILCPKGTTFQDVSRHKEKIHSVAESGMSVDKDTLEISTVKDPVSISSKRVYVRTSEEGGTERDGTIEIRPGVKDLNLGNSRYAQVRVLVDGDKYMKGMAYYSDDIPDGYDIVYNSNKSKNQPEKWFKEIDEKYKKDDIRPVDRFGAVITKQNSYTDSNGNTHQGALNIVNEEGAYADWSDTVAAQFLSKQRPEVAQQQLRKDYNSRFDSFNEINSLTNPMLRKTLLEPFADECDSAAVDLKAAAFPKQGWHVILPNPKLKPNEIYAPNYNTGDKVILIRYPHGGTFEIPELVVNNNHASSKKMLGTNPSDAVVINHKVAEQLSGADFDGDTVLVIPNNDGKFRIKKPLKELEGFDTKAAYPPVKYTDPDTGEEYERKAVVDKVTDPKKQYLWKEQLQMGMVSNLITDMTLAGAPDEELARAVKHSMVVIDVRKHNLDWRRSERENGIQELKNKYQPKEDPNKPGGGASTLISRASSEERIPERKMAFNTKDEDGNYIVKSGVYVDTGKKAYQPTNRTYRQQNKNTGEWDKEVVAESKSTKMYEAEDARTLMSGQNHEGTLIERIYADYANKCKALGNRARKEWVSIDIPPKNPEATKKYAAEVQELEKALLDAQKNDPIERLAHIKAGLIIKSMRQDGMSLSAADWTKEKQKALARARRDLGAHRHNIDITDRQWEAIQANALSGTKLKEIFKYTDLDKLKQRALPREENIISDATMSRARAYARSGRSQREIAEALGISVSSVRRILNGEV